jgi:hypothetical protein
VKWTIDVVLPGFGRIRVYKGEKRKDTKNLFKKASVQVRWRRGKDGFSFEDGQSGLQQVAE